MLQNIIKRILAILGAKVLVGGLEVSDYTLRFSLFDGSAWRFAAVRLLPGTMVGGEIKNKEQFLGALRELRAALLGNSRKRITVILTLGSVQIYSEIFSLPLVEGAYLDKAVQLNIQMNAPVKVNELYTGWEIIEKDEAARRLDILSAFIKQQLVDSMIDTFSEAGYIVAAVEPKALALTRLASRGGSGFAENVPAVVLNIDASGLNFIIVRKGHFYFEYPNQWQDIEDEKGNVLLADFSKAIIRSIHQVVNFYAQHWAEEIHDIYIISSVLRDEIGRVVKENFSTLTPHFLEFRDLPTLDPQWFAAVGSGIRGSVPRRADRELSLMGVGAYEVYVRGRLADFLLFWRTIFPVVLGLFLVLMAVADFSLTSIHETHRVTQHATEPSSDISRSIDALSKDIAAFNASVVYIKTAESSITMKSPLFAKLFGLLGAHSVSLSRLTLSQGNAVLLSGSAPSQADILGLEKDLGGDPAFTQVNLPLNSITPSIQGVSFVITFSYIP